MYKPETEFSALSINILKYYIKKNAKKKRKLCWLCDTPNSWNPVSPHSVHCYGGPDTMKSHSISGTPCELSPCLASLLSSRSVYDWEISYLLCGSALHTWIRYSQPSHQANLTLYLNGNGSIESVKFSLHLLTLYLLNVMAYKSYKDYCCWNSLLFNH